MKILRSLVIILSILLVSSIGITGLAFSESHNIPPLSASSESPLYENGDTVTIKGAIRDYDRTDKTAVTVIIVDPNNVIVGISQIEPDRDTGEYEAKFIASGPLWKVSGEYTAKVQYGRQSSAETTFQFTGGVALTCGENQELVNGKCIDKEPPESKTPICGPDEKLVNNKCVPKSPEAPQCGPDQILVNNQCMDKEPEVQPIICGEGTVLVGGQCVPEETEEPPRSGCLIATAAFGSELSPQVQMLREIRDNTVYSTQSGASFMSAFNAFYYSFSPTVADWERQNPVFKEAVKVTITPLLSSLSLLQLVDIDTEQEMLGYGIGIILLNIGMYFVAPALIIFKLKNRRK